MNIVINDFIDLGVLGELPCVICGKVISYGGGMQMVELVAVDCGGINLLPLVEKDRELFADYAQQLKDEVDDNARDLADTVAAGFRHDEAIEELAMNAGRY